MGEFILATTSDLGCTNPRVVRGKACEVRRGQNISESSLKKLAGISIVERVSAYFHRKCRPSVEHKVAREVRGGDVGERVKAERDVLLGPGQWTCPRIFYLSARSTLKIEYVLHNITSLQSVEF